MALRLLSSLRHRTFVATALVALVSLASAIELIANRITREADAERRAGLAAAADLAERHHAQRLETLTLVARLIADLPKLKAAVETGDAPTVQPLAQDYLDQTKADSLVVTGAQGRTLAALGNADPDEASVRQALSGRTVVSTRAARGHLQEVVTVPIGIGVGVPEVLGTLALGLALDQRLAADLRGASASEVALVSEGIVLAATAPLPTDDILAASKQRTMAAVGHGDAEYAALARPLLTPSGAPNLTVVLLRSPTERLRFLRAMRTGLAGAGVVAVALAVLLSYAVARSVTRPLADVASAMREMTRSGDFARGIPQSGRWDDEDARVLAAAFRALTDSIRRFQREAAQKERLSALGRMSTVIAHEVRNPLMIIKASLRVLRRSGLGEQERTEAAADIDQEVDRLDRLVQEVLEYARPMKVEVAITDLGALCRDAAAAVDRSGARVAVQIAPDVPTLRTDGERLRRALINLLTNAREAIGPAAPDESASPIELRAARSPVGNTVLIDVEDHGPGIAAADLPHVFEPYFSTKRTGTGLGLAITRNIVESLGGSITAQSEVGRGTRVRLELPDLE